jgi:hypothetical protein
MFEDFSNIPLFCCFSFRKQSSTNLSETLLIILLSVIETMIFSQTSHAILVVFKGFQDGIFHDQDCHLRASVN